MGEGQFTAGEKIRRRITLKKGVIESENGIDMDEIISGLRHIAFGSSADAIKLLLHSDTLTGRQIKKLDTFNIASIKQTGSCISEIKFFDRGKAMEKLAQLCVSQSAGANGFLEALARSAGATADEEDSALAAGESGSLGIEITANGFRVKNGSTHAVSGITPLLNEAGTGYVYFAFRGVSA